MLCTKFNIYVFITHKTVSCLKYIQISERNTNARFPSAMFFFVVVPFCRLLYRNEKKSATQKVIYFRFAYSESINYLSKNEIL